MIMYSVQNCKHGLEAEFSAKLSNIDYFCKQVEDYLDANGLEKEKFQVILGLREILTNAIRHGCAGDSQQQIRAGISYGAGSISLFAEDPGEGYDWQKMLKCPPGIYTESGRGLCILQEYFSSLDINEQGNRIVLHKEIAK